MTPAAVGLAAGVVCAVVGFVPTRRFVPPRPNSTTIVVSVVAAVAAGVVLAVFDAPAPLAPLAGATGAVIASEAAEARIPHRLSAALLAAVLAVAAAITVAALIAATVCAAVVLAACAAAGVSPAGGDMFLTRRRASAGQPPLMGGGDPAWIAATLAAVAAGAAADPGADPVAIAAAADTAVAMTIAGFGGIVSLAVRPLRHGPRQMRFGPAAAVAAIAAGCL